MTDQPIPAHGSQVASTSLGAVKSPRFPPLSLVRHLPLYAKRRDHLAAVGFRQRLTSYIRWPAPAAN